MNLAASLFYGMIWFTVPLVIVTSAFTWHNAQLSANCEYSRPVPTYAAKSRGRASTISVAIAFVVITSLHIVAGELAPKGIALQKTEKTALWVARPIQWFYFVFRWPTRILNGTGNALLRVFGLRPATAVGEAQPPSGNDAAAPTTVIDRHPVAVSPFDLTYLPAETRLVLAIQPAAILWQMSDGEFDVTGHTERAWTVFVQAILAKQAEQLT